MATASKNRTFKAFRPSELFKIKEEALYDYADRDIQLRSYADTMVADVTLDDGTRETFINDRAKKTWTKTSDDVTTLPDPIDFEAYGRDTSILVRWTNAANNDGYRIYIDDWWVDVPKDTDNFIVRTLHNTQTPNFKFQNGTSYEVTLAVLTQGKQKLLAGAYSQPVDVLVGNRPDALQNIAVDILPQNIVEITFASHPNIQPPVTGYELVDKTNGTVMQGLALKFVTTGWALGERRQYEIYAVNKIGKGIPTTLNILYDMVVPAPTNVTAAQASTPTPAQPATATTPAVPAGSVAKRGYLDVSWTHPNTTSLLLNYEVAYKLKNMTTWTSVVVPTSQNNTQIGLLQVGTYNVRVRGQGQTNHSAWTDATPTDVPIASTADAVDPQSIKAKVVGQNIQVDWDAAVGALEYNVYVDGVLAGTVKPVPATPPASGTTLPTTFNIAIQANKTTYDIEIESVGSNGNAPKSKMVPPFSFSLQELTIKSVTFFMEKKVVKARVRYENTVTNGVPPTATNVSLTATASGVTSMQTVTFDTTLASGEVVITGLPNAAFDNYLTKLSFEVQQSHIGVVKTTTYDFDVNVLKVVPVDVTVKTDYLFDILQGQNEWETKIFAQTNTEIKVDALNDGVNISDATQDIGLPATGQTLTSTQMEQGSLLFSSNNKKDSFLIRKTPDADWNLPLTFFGTGGITATNVVAGTDTYGNFKVLPITFGGNSKFALDAANKKIVATHGYVPYVQFQGNSLGFKAEDAIAHLVLVAGKKRIVPTVTNTVTTTGATEYTVAEDISAVTAAYFKTNFYFENFLFGFETGAVTQATWQLVAAGSKPDDFVTFTIGSGYSRNNNVSLESMAYTQYNALYKDGDDVLVDSYVDDDGKNIVSGTALIRRTAQLSNGKFASPYERNFGSSNDGIPFTLRNYINGNKLVIPYRNNGSFELWELSKNSARSENPVKHGTIGNYIQGVIPVGNELFAVQSNGGRNLLYNTLAGLISRDNGATWIKNMETKMPFGKDVVMHKVAGKDEVFVVSARPDIGGDPVVVASMYKGDGTLIWKRDVVDPATNPGSFLRTTYSSSSSNSNSSEFLLSCYVAKNGDIYFNNTTDLYGSTDNGVSWTRLTGFTNSEKIATNVVELDNGEVGCIVAGQLGSDMYYRFTSQLHRQYIGNRIIRYSGNVNIDKRHINGVQKCAVIKNVVVFLDIRQNTSTLVFFNVASNIGYLGDSQGSSPPSAAADAAAFNEGLQIFYIGNNGKDIFETSGESYFLIGNKYRYNAIGASFNVATTSNIVLRDMSGNNVAITHIMPEAYFGSASIVLRKNIANNQIAKVYLDTGYSIDVNLTKTLDRVSINFNYDPDNPYNKIPKFGSQFSDLQNYVKKPLLFEDGNNIYMVVWNVVYALVFMTKDFGVTWDAHGKIFFDDPLQYVVTDADFDSGDLVFSGVGASNQRIQVQKIKFSDVFGTTFISQKGSSLSFAPSYKANPMPATLVGIQRGVVLVFYHKNMYSIPLANFDAQHVTPYENFMPADVRNTFTYQGQKFLVAKGDKGIFATGNFKTFNKVATGTLFTTTPFTNTDTMQVFADGDAPIVTSNTSINRMRDFQTATNINNAIPLAAGERVEKLHYPVALSNSDLALWVIIHDTNKTMHLAYVSENSASVETTAAYKMTLPAGPEAITFGGGFWHKGKFYVVVRIYDVMAATAQVFLREYTVSIQNGTTQSFTQVSNVQMNFGTGIVGEEVQAIKVSDNGVFVALSYFDTAGVFRNSVMHSTDLVQWSALADFSFDHTQDTWLEIDDDGLYHIGSTVQFLPFIKPNTP